MDNLDDLKRKKDYYRILFIALLVVFIFALFSFIISIVSLEQEKLQLKEILYIIVMALSFIFATLFLVLFINIKKKITNQERNQDGN